MHEKFLCDACPQGKIHQKQHVIQSVKTTTAFQFVRSNIWGPASQSSSHGFKYYLSFVDDFTRYVWIYPLSLKSEAATIIKSFITMVQCRFHVNVEKFQTDWGGEFRSLVSCFQSQDIHFQHPCPYIHSQNGS